MSGQRRPNQADIAARLGVSVSTVSRALANEAGISETVRRDVERAARLLGYKSKHLPTGGPAQHKVLALVPLGDATGGLSAFYLDIVEGLRAAAAEAQMALELRLVNERTVTLDTIRRQVAQASAHGLLLAGIDATDSLATWSREEGVAVVLVNACDPQMRLSSVAPANFFGAFGATQRLLDAGHRHIIHYTRAHRPTILQRQYGFEAAMRGVPGAQPLVVRAEEGQPAALLRALATRRLRATAILAWNDLAAVELLDGLGGSDSDRGEPISVVGFDDLPIAAMATPRLATVRIDRDAIGRGAVQMLGRLLGGERAPQHLEIGVTQVEGETVFAIGEKSDASGKRGAGAPLASEADAPKHGISESQLD